MKIRIVSDKVNLSMPIPWAMASFAIQRLPDSLFEELRGKIQPPYDQLICRENLQFLYQACRNELMDWQGLEIIHIDRRDGLFLSVIL